MDDELILYIRQRDQLCRETAERCTNPEQRIQWLERAVEWAAIAREVEFQRETASQIAPLIPVDPKPRLKL
jgi:hypothetical protein